MYICVNKYINTSTYIKYNQIYHVDKYVCLLEGKSMRLGMDVCVLKLASWMCNVYTCTYAFYTCLLNGAMVIAWHGPHPLAT